MALLVEDEETGEDFIVGGFGPAVSLGLFALTFTFCRLGVWLVLLVQRTLRRPQRVGQSPAKGVCIRFLQWVMDTCRWIVDVVLRPEGSKGFVMIPKRWTVVGEACRRHTNLRLVTLVPSP